MSRLRPHIEKARLACFRSPGCSAAAGDSSAVTAANVTAAVDAYLDKRLGTAEEAA
jgi:hypothetical protein